MSGAMIKLVAKFGHRIPELLTRAALGDPTAIAILAALGAAGIGTAIKERNASKNRK